MRVLAAVVGWGSIVLGCPAPPGRTEAACVALADGRYLLLGGSGTNAVEVYEPGGSWTTVGSLGMARWGHTATPLADGRILIAGGQTFSGLTSSLETYDPVTNRFTPLAAALSAARSGHEARLLPDGRVHLSGGDLFDPASGTVAAAPYPRTITFAGETWYVKTSSERVGPGPNYFSDRTTNVWVDTAGRLHLKITRSGGRWYCAEVVSARSFGYGTYRFYLDSSADTLDPNVVLGLFTWNDDPAFYNREIDVELSRWGSRNNLNAQYVVQPYTDPRNVFRFQQPPGPSTHEFTWQPGVVTFQSTNAGGLIASHTDNSGIPEAGGENARMNLWLFRGRGPSDKKEVEVIVQGFAFTP